MSLPKKVSKEFPQGISDERLSELKCIVRHCSKKSIENFENLLSQIKICNDDDDFFKQLKDKLNLVEESAILTCAKQLARNPNNPCKQYPSQ